MPNPPAAQLKREPTLTAPPLSPPPPRKRPRRHSATPAPLPSSSSTPPQSTHPSSPRRQPTVPSPAPGHIRIYAWNVNGIAPLLHQHQHKRPRQQPITTFFNHPTTATSNGTTTKQTQPPSPRKPRSLRACLRHWKYPEIVCLQEIQIAPSDTTTLRAVQEAINPCSPRLSSAPSSDDSASSSSDDDDGGPGPSYTAYFALPRSAYNARGRGGSGKIYGVATLVRDDFGEREVRVAGREVEWDREGRVLVTELRCGVLVMNVYAVNGTENVWRDERDGMVLGTRHEKKRAFHGELVGEWRGWVDGQLGEGEGDREKGRGREVLMIGDMNVARDERDGWPGIRLGEQHVRNRADFERRFFGGVGQGGLGAVDTFREVHGEERRYSYFPSGRVWGSSCDRVDLGVVSGGVVDRGWLVGADILDDVKERASSDHVPLYVVLKVRENTTEKNGGA